VDRTATKQIDFSQPSTKRRPGGVEERRCVRVQFSISQAEQSHGIAEAFPFPCRMCVCVCVCVCIKLENTRMHTPSHTSATSATAIARNFISPILDGRCNTNADITADFQIKYY